MGHYIEKWQHEPERKKVYIEHEIRIREVQDDAGSYIRIAVILALIGLIGSALFGG